MQNKGNKKKRSPLIFVIPVSLIVIGIAIFIRNKDEYSSNYDGNSLIGSFFYSENKTKYTFKEDGTGSMSSDDYNFKYKYKVDGNILSIDFEKNEVNDAKYSFELDNGTLKLISKEGTVSIGQEYILKKESK